MKITWWEKDFYPGRGRRGTSWQWRRLAPALALGVLVIAAVLAAPLCHALEDRSWGAGHQGAALDAPGPLLAGSQPPGRLGGDGDDDDDDEGDCNP